jgi:hypothetical protein
MSIEQKIVLYLADLGYITDVVAATAALEHQNIADWLITGDGLQDEVEEAIESGEIEVDTCDHEALTGDEINQVFEPGIIENEENKQNKQNK